jgi:diacylglycerol kinase (ATP)
VREPAFVLLNPAARQGRGRERWYRVRSEVEARFAPTVVPLDRGGAWRESVDSALLAGVHVFVAAGGDGTVHSLVEALARRHGAVPVETLLLGAVGLGSSNDFHKPASAVRGGIPLRLEAAHASARDLGSVRWVRPDGSAGETVLVVSASVGAAAEGNALFARSSSRGLFPGASIAAASLRAVAAHRPFPMRVELDGSAFELSLSSLSVLKTPWLSGSLRFDLPALPADGLLWVALFEGRGRLRLLAALAALARGRFRGREGNRAFAVRSLSLSSDRPFLLEVDGEVETVVSATFHLFPWRLRACA